MNFGPIQQLQRNLKQKLVQKLTQKCYCSTFRKFCIFWQYIAHTIAFCNKFVLSLTKLSFVDCDSDEGFKGDRDHCSRCPG